MRPCRRGGFTLLELITVVIILAMLSAAVIPMFGESLHAMRVETSIDDVITAMKSTHERAIIETQEFRFYIDDDEQQYWVEAFAGFDEDLEKTFEPVALNYGRRASLNSDLEFQKPRARRDKARDAYFVAFYPSGAVDEATIRIDDGPGRRKIRIDTKGQLGQFDVSGRDKRSVW